MKFLQGLYIVATLIFCVTLPSQIQAQTDISGSWSNITAYGTGQNDVYCQGLYNNDQEIRYGADNYNSGYWDSMCYYTNKPSGQSGLGFFGTQGLTFSCQDESQAKVLYNLGEFKHFNESVYIRNFGHPVFDESLGGGQLSISLSGDLSATYSFDVDFEETPNDPNGYPQGNYQTLGCPYGTFNNKCNDRVSIENVVDPGNAVIINGQQCQIVIEGFGDCATSVEQDPVEFVTTEGSINSSCVWASMSPPPAVYGAIGDYVWGDVDADGIQDDEESGLDNIRVEVYESVDNAPFVYREFTTTNAAGYYDFANLESERAYKIYIDPGTLAPGEITARKQGNKRSKDSNAYASGFTNKVTIQPNQFKTNIDIGIVPNAQVGSLQGLAWIDRSGDGTLESPAEQAAPVAGATISLFEDHNGDGIGDGASVQTAITSGDGEYSFPGLNPSINYVVGISNIPNTLPGTVAAWNAGSDDTIDSDFDPATLTTGSLNIEPEAILDNVDVGVNAGGIVIIIHDGGELPGGYDPNGEEPEHATNDYLFIGAAIGGNVNASEKTKSFDRSELSRVALDDGIEGPSFAPDEPVMGFDFNVTITSNAWAMLSCFVDYDINGVFEEDERTDVAIMGSNVYRVPMESTEDVSAGSTFGRCRLAYDSSEVESPGGPASSGEVEDFPFQIGANLPVELLSFEGELVQGQIVLNWATGSEENNAGFYVERSINGLGFQRVGFVEGNGTVNTESTYSIALSELDPGVHTYRLKQVDHDGRFEYSRSIEVSVDLPTNLHLSDAYPNPFNPQSTIRFTVKNETEVTIGLYDLSGRLRATLFEGIQEAGTSREIQIDGSDLSSGTYFVQLSSPLDVVQKTITIAK